MPFIAFVLVAACQSAPTPIDLGPFPPPPEPTEARPVRTLDPERALAEALARDEEKLAGLIDGLGLGHPLGPKGAAELAASPRLAQLTRLNLSGQALGDAGLEAFAASPHVSGVQVLVLTSNGIPAAGVEALARSSNLPNLTHLYLAHNPIGAAGVRALGSSRASGASNG